MLHPGLPPSPSSSPECHASLHWSVTSQSFQAGAAGSLIGQQDPRSCLQSSRPWTELWAPHMGFRFFNLSPFLQMSSCLVRYLL